MIALIVAVSNRDDGAGRVVPASTVEDTAVVTPTTTSASTVPSTTPSALATTWAPVNLPEGMRVVDVSWGSVLPGFARPLATQNFARLSADGTTHEATLTLRVTKTEQGQPEFSTGTVHGLPASIVVLTDPPGPVVGWWVEHDLIVEFNATGFDIAQVVELLDATTWRADLSHGFEPDSISGGMSLLYEVVGTQPRPYTRYVVESDSGYGTVEITSGVHGLPDASLGTIPGVGQLLETTWSTVVLTDDGTAISISVCCLPNGSPYGVSPEALAVAGSIAHVDEAAVIALAAVAAARELALPEVGRVVVGANEVVLRGGTPELPEALCVVASGVEGCSFNHRVQSDSDFSLGWTNEWLLSGDNWFFVMYRPNEVGFGTASVCPANADGSFGEPLPYDLAIEADQVWTLTQIPADAAFTMVCGWARAGEPVSLLPANNISYIVRRPPG